MAFRLAPPAPSRDVTGTHSNSHGGAVPRGDGAGISFAVGRARGTVVVTVHGTIDGDGSGALADVLIDLIENQGNLDVVVDLGGLRAPRGPEVAVFARAARCAFARAARSADRRGASLVLADPAADVAAALEAAGLGDITVHRSGDARAGGHLPATAVAGGPGRASGAARMGPHPPRRDTAPGTRGA